jgi:hypothetical protein
LVATFSSVQPQLIDALARHDHDPFDVADDPVARRTRGRAQSRS